MLEDKCKWGESFVFVYDVTDRYSFDELTRLKFIASYTHSRMRVNFTPCWVLVGNKADLAERERMVSFEEGKTLARDLGCHMFREISAKESMNEAAEVFEDLWRHFSQLSPRSPSSSQRRKFSIRIQDKIPVLDSHSCSTCTPETIKQTTVHVNGSVGSSHLNTLRRQTSVPTMLGSRLSKDVIMNDSNNNEEKIESPRSIPCIPEHAEEEESKDVDTRQRRSFMQRRTRRNAISHDLPENKPSFPLFARKKTLCKSMSVDNMYSNVSPHSPTGTGTPLTSSSRSSSNSSLNGSTSPGIRSGKLNPFDRLRGYEPKYHTHHNHTDQSDELVTLYQDYCRRHRARRNELCKYGRLMSPQSLSSSPACEVNEVGGS